MAIGDKKRVLMEGTTAAEVGALALDGSSIMTGDVAISPASETGGGIVRYSGDGLWLESRNGKNAGGTYRSLLIQSSRAAESIANCIRLADRINGSSQYYTIFHTGNKPNGTYTGNGDPAERKIETGGVGNIILIWSGSHGSVLITPNGGLKLYGGNMECFAYASVRAVGNGGFTISTAHEALNANGVTYSYQVL